MQSRICSRSPLPTRPPVARRPLPAGHARDRAARSDRRHASRGPRRSASTRRATGRSTYGINGVPFAKAKPCQGRVGETQVWTVTNKTPVVASVPPARLLLPGARRATGSPVRPLAVEGHRERSVQGDACACRAVRRSTGHWMYPLPHPRPRRRRPHGCGAAVPPWGAGAPVAVGAHPSRLSVKDTCLCDPCDLCGQDFAFFVVSITEYACSVSCNSPAVRTARNDTQCSQ